MFLSLHYFFLDVSMFWNSPLEVSSDSHKIENEANIKTSEDRTKSKESEDREDSGKKRDRVEIAKTKGSTASEETDDREDSGENREKVGIGKTKVSKASEESKGGTGSEKSKDERAHEKRGDEEICGDRLVSEDYEGKAKLRTSPVVSKRKLSRLFLLKIDKTGRLSPCCLVNPYK